MIKYDGEGIHQLKNYGFPRRYWNIRREDWQGNLPNIDIDENKGYFCTGTGGIGKTMFASLCGKHIFSKTETIKWGIGTAYADEEKRSFYSCLFVSVPDFLLEIQETFNSHESSEDIIADYADVDFLILDDLGAEKASDWAIQMLYVLIDRRERSGNNRIIITSNLSLDEIAEKLSDRIASRIRGMCKVIKFQGNDRRLGK